jgi:AcrR family transcriptional regulator
MTDSLVPSALVLRDFVVKPTPGRREAHKQAVRAGLLDAATRLFGQQGYEATTVRQIADTAKVTERTFYRYFDGKEGLLAQDALAWMNALSDAIRARPPDERPFPAVRHAMLETARGSGRTSAAPVLWQLTAGQRPLETLRRAAPRPLRRLEQSIAAAVLARTPSEPAGLPSGPDSATPNRAALDEPAEYEAQLLARVAVAVLRTAVIRHRQLEADPETQSPGIVGLLDDAFAALTGLAH